MDWSKLLLHDFKAHRVRLSHSRDDPGDQDLHQGLVIVTGQKLRLAGDFLKGSFEIISSEIIQKKCCHLQRLDDCTEFVDNDRVLKREEVASLGEVFPLQHLPSKKGDLWIILPEFYFLQHLLI